MQCQELEDPKGKFITFRALGRSYSYSVGGVHRHLGEFDQELFKIAGRSVNIQFTPHLIPANEEF